jgi:hypothetical protein
VIEKTIRNRETPATANAPLNLSSRITTAHDDTVN